MSQRQKDNISVTSQSINFNWNNNKNQENKQMTMLRGIKNNSKTNVNESHLNQSQSQHEENKQDNNWHRPPLIKKRKVMRNIRNEYDDEGQTDNDINKDTDNFGGGSYYDQRGYHDNDYGNNYINNKNGNQARYYDDHRGYNAYRNNNNNKGGGYGNNSGNSRGGDTNNYNNNGNKAGGNAYHGHKFNVNPDTYNNNNTGKGTAAPYGGNNNNGGYGGNNNNNGGYGNNGQGGYQHKQRGGFRGRGYTQNQYNHQNTDNGRGSGGGSGRGRGRGRGGYGLTYRSGVREPGHRYGGGGNGGGSYSSQYKSYSAYTPYEHGIIRGGHRHGFNEKQMNGMSQSRQSQTKYDHTNSTSDAKSKKKNPYDSLTIFRESELEIVRKSKKRVAIFVYDDSCDDADEFIQILDNIACDHPEAIFCSTKWDCIPSMRDEFGLDPGMLPCLVCLIDDQVGARMKKLKWAKDTLFGNLDTNIVIEELYKQRIINKKSSSYKSSRISNEYVYE